MNAIERGIGSAKPLTLYGVEVASRLLLGTSRYPSPQVMSDAVKAARVDIVRVALALLGTPTPADIRPEHLAG